MCRWLMAGFLWGLPLFPNVVLLGSESHKKPADNPPAPIVQKLIGDFCVDCHHGRDSAADLNLKSLSRVPVSQNTPGWEKVVRKLRARQMPPREMPRPEGKIYEGVLRSLEGTLDEIAAAHPQPGRTETFRRLTRTEYQNAIRDLLALDIDARALLPAEESSHGFDNITVGESLAHAAEPLHLRGPEDQPACGRQAFDRRREDDSASARSDAGRADGRAAAGHARRGVDPLHFPPDGEYEIQIRLARDRNEQVEGLNEPHEMEVLLDLERIALFTVKPPRGHAKSDAGYSQASHANVDRHLKTRVRVKAGPHELGVTFLKNPSSLLETQRQPLNAHFNMHRHPRLGLRSIRFRSPARLKREVPATRPAGDESSSVARKAPATKKAVRGAFSPI